MKNIILVAAVVLCGGYLMGQQTTASTFFDKSYGFYNPAYAGFNTQMAYDVYARQQWLGFGKGAPTTINADVQYPLVNNNMGVAGGLFFDKTGPVSKRGVSGQYAYKIDEMGYNDAKFSMGIGLGLHQYAFDPTNEVIVDPIDPLLAGNTKSSFFPAVSLGAFYESSDVTFKNNTVFFGGVGYQQAYRANLLIDNINPRRASHLVVDMGARIYGYDYQWTPRISINYSNPELLQTLFGLNFEMKDVFWAGLGYASSQEISLQGGYIFDEIGGRDTRLRMGLLATMGMSDNIRTFGPSLEMIFRYELDMD